MIALGPTDSLYGMAATASAVSCTLGGMESSGTVDSPKMFDQRFLPTGSPTLLYTPGTGKSALVKIKLANVTNAPVTVTLYQNGSASVNTISTLPIPAFGEATYDGNGWSVLDSQGGIVQGSAVVPIDTTSTQVGLTGDKTTTGSWTFGKVNVIGGAVGATGVGLLDNGNRAYSDSNPPETLLLTETPAASPPGTPASGYGVQYLPDDGSAPRVKNDAGTIFRMLTDAERSIIVNYKKGWVNILDYGADPTNATSSRSALAAAEAALPNGGVIYFPPGSYNFGNTAYLITTAHITLQGAARYNTNLTTTSLTEDIIQIGQYYNTIQDLAFIGPGTSQSPTRTAGFAINGNGSGFPAYTAVRRCTFFYQYDCINVANQLMTVDDIECRYFKHSGCIVNHNSDHRITQMVCDNSTSFLPTGGGIQVLLTASLLLEQCNIIHANNALDIAPASGVTIPSVKGVNCFFDTSVNGLNMTSAGSFLRSEFTNCWFSSMSQNGINLQPAAGGQVHGVTFINCDIYNNVAGTTQGVNTNSLVQKWKMIGCSIAGWTTGVNLVAGANHYPSLIGNTIGSVSAFGVNTTGVAMGAGTYKGFVLADNDIVDNTVTFTDAGMVTTNLKVISNNSGIVAGTGALATVLAAVTTSATAATETVMLRATIPANSVVAGQQFRITVWGISVSTGTKTWRMRAGANGTTADGQLWVTAASAAAVANDHFTMTGLVTVRTIGSSGTIVGDGQAVLHTAPPVITQTGVGVVTVGTVNTTAQWFLEVDLTDSIASGSTIQGGTIEAL